MEEAPRSFAQTKDPAQLTAAESFVGDSPPFHTANKRGRTKGQAWPVPWRHLECPSHLHKLSQNVMLSAVPTQTHSPGVRRPEF